MYIYIYRERERDNINYARATENNNSTKQAYRGTNTVGRDTNAAVKYMYYDSYISLYIYIYICVCIRVYNTLSL